MASSGTEWSEAWVQLYRNESDSYYWNRHTGETTYEKMDAMWHGMTEKVTGRWYFWKPGTSEPVWWLPELSGRFSAFQLEPTGLVQEDAKQSELPTPSNPEQETQAVLPGTPREQVEPSIAPHENVGFPATPAYLEPPRNVQALPLALRESLPLALRENPSFTHGGSTGRAAAKKIQQVSPPQPRAVENLNLVSNAWVEVMDTARYYWNYECGCHLDALPPGASPRWRAHSSSNGWYYQNVRTNEQTRDLPSCGFETCMESQQVDCAWMEINAPVIVIGLTAQPLYNEHVGTLLGVTAGRCLVRLPKEQSSVVLGVEPRNVQRLPSGTLVELHGLKMAELNGMLGQVKGWDIKEHRYHVLVSDGGEKFVKAINLQVRSRLWNLNDSIDAAIRSGRTLTHLQWRSETQCTFVDSNGQHRTYALHLPLGFNPRQNHKHERWPLLLYLHGGGGATFFNMSKKTMKTVGMQYAAREFVVVSPHCKWTWRDTPHEWVAELVKALRPLEWLDHTRMYLTGCSMGGMGAWEVGSQIPNIFAAVSPVAAHHQLERSAMIAQRLRSTPLYVVHDDTDTTCPIREEEVLWQMLDDLGHPDFQKLVLHNVDHCKVHEPAYCDDEHLYRWLLTKTLRETDDS